MSYLDDEELNATRKLHGLDKKEREMIEVGEYGRTNTGKIFIFAWLEYEVGKIDKNKVILGDGKTFANNFYYFKEKENIVKHSKNIIDLIKVDDYVNGCKVIKVSPCGSWIEIDNNKSSIETTLWNEDIKSIVTKEQFSQAEYIVKKVVKN